MAVTADKRASTVQLSICARPQCKQLFFPKANSQGLYCSKRCGYIEKRKQYREIKDGYVVIYPDPEKYFDVKYPGARGDGRIFEHRYIMQEYLGRPLLPNETIHHLNGCKTDNKMNNLELRAGNHGKGWVVDQHCPTCTCSFPGG